MKPLLNLIIIRNNKERLLHFLDHEEYYYARLALFALRRGLGEDPEPVTADTRLNVGERARVKRAYAEME